MKFALVLVVIIGVVSLVSTILVANRVEAEYSKSVKRNLTNLTLMYVLLFLVLSVGIVWYIVGVR
ncbi:hypothetical protein [Ectobacillus ponti]|uniref:Uncharacterized protein n=1 Tax=Ectobacillus ponti TaxID=2961894 RepID=A0AA41X8W8_9BACI|nr:hypothetical protein [Ectobacillus ponti]MCP8969288.1 hypothetical protein [Ectobacillus ponti]